MKRSKYVLAVLIGTVALLNGRERDRPSVSSNAGRVSIGRPKLWPVSSALSMIDETRSQLRKLSIEYPANNKLSPSAINLRELEFVKSFFGLSVTFDQLALTKNLRGLEQDSFNRQVAVDTIARYQRAQAELVTLKAKEAGYNAQKAKTDSEVASLQTQIAAIDAKLQQTGAGAPTAAEATALQTKKADLQRTKESTELASARLAQEIAYLAPLIKLNSDEVTALDAKAKIPDIPSTVANTPAPAAPAAPADNAEIKKSVSERLDSILKQDPQLHLLEILNNIGDSEIQLMMKKLTLAQESIDPDYNLYFMELSGSPDPGPGSANQRAVLRWRASCAAPEKPTDAGYEHRAKPFSQYAWKNDPRIQEIHKIEEANHQPFVFELTPVQGKVLTAASTGFDKGRSFGFSIASFFGLGGSLSSTKNQVSGQNSIRREVFVAGFGKGDSVFGWDIYPSDDRLVLPGSFTGYGLLAVPKACRTLTFHGQGAFHPADSFLDTEQLHTFNGKESVKVDLLDDNSAPWVAAVAYRHEKPGQMTTLIFNGRGFAPETTVLVNGNALGKVERFGTAANQNSVMPAASTAAPGDVAGCQGEFTMPSTTALVMRLSCAKTYTGTPTIALLTPTKSIFLDAVKMNVRVDGHEDKFVTIGETGLWK